MKKSLFKSNSLLLIIYNSLINLPTPLNINIWWNFGSMLGFMLMVQIISGFILSMHYCPSTLMAFKSIIHIIQDMNYGWLFRNIHMNGASMFFILMYIHIGRNIYYNNFLSIHTWFSGIMIFLMSMITAFMGYVLPWGQMSFWGATVITNLISTIPYIGTMLVYWLWGDFYVSNATLNRFFSFHFILPMIIMMMVIIHLLMLHNYGSSNPLGTSNKMIMIPFHPFYTIKDILGMWLLLITMMTISLLNPYLFNDPENFNEANPMITPIHIQPEWYFLFAYAILRSIPNKLGGVIALLMSILILFILPMNFNYKIKSFKFNYFNQMFYWMFISLFIILTLIGAKPVENPYIIIGQTMSIMYFMYFMLMPYLSKLNDLFIFK